MRRISEGILTFGYVGRLPGMPGTWASAVTALLCLLLSGSRLYLPLVLAGAGVLFALGVFLARDAVRLFGAPDPGAIVLDEVVGMLLAAALGPDGTLSGKVLGPGAPVLLLCFVLFRLLDILKPPFIRQAERLPRGLGIFMDDVLAGLYTNALVRILLLVV